MDSVVLEDKIRYLTAVSDTFLDLDKAVDSMLDLRNLSEVDAELCQAAVRQMSEAATSLRLVRFRAR